MGATASLSAPRVEVVPGGRASVELLVRNNGSVVDDFSFSVLGEAAAWATVEPASVSLFPGAEASAQVSFAPPRAPASRAGESAFGLMVRSREDPEGSTVEEATIAVAAFMDASAELIPRAGRARHAARYRVAVDNRGNVTLPADLAGVDPGGNVEVLVSPRGLEVPPGATMFARVSATTSHWIWKGSPNTLPFAVVVSPTDQSAPPITCDGTLLHEPVFPRWLPKALLALLALVAAAVAAWYGLLRPNIRAQAQSAAQAQTAKAVAQAHQAAMAAQAAQQAATNANHAAGTAAQSAGMAAQAATKVTGKAFTPSPPTTLAGPATTATGGRVVLSVPPGATVSDALAGIPPKKAFELTDVIFENPDGDSGSVSLMRGGAVVLFENLANFRDLDYHFVSPISFPAGTPVMFSGTCANPVAAKVPCQPGVYLGGYLG